MRTLLFLGVFLLALAPRAEAAPLPTNNPPAFVLARSGDQYLDPKARDKIIEIHSEQSTNGLVPGVWYIDYFDPTTVFKRTELKFVAGQMVENTKPKRFVDVFSGSKQLSWRKLKVDSDRALAIALKQPQLTNVHLQATQFWLTRTVNAADWKIRFWTRSVGKPDELSEIGDLYISTRTGEVLKNELHF